MSDERAKCDLDALEKLAGDTDVENLHVACDEIARLRAGLEWALDALADIQRADSHRVSAEQRQRMDDLRKLLGDVP